MKHLLAGAGALWLGLSGHAFAQDDEIVVTAARYQERYEEDVIPHVAVTRRADFLVARVEIESDSRDLEPRRAELVQTVNEIERRARAGGPVSVALLEESDEDAGDTRVKPFSAAAAMSQIGAGSRPDTSRLALLLRTPIQQADTLASAEARLDAFVRALPKPGRIAVTTGDAELTIVNPGQYRTQVVSAVAADAQRILTALGPGYGVSIDGLEKRIAWRRSSDLELTLYIPHHIAVAPLPGR
jgi:hypothetical protein